MTVARKPGRRGERGISRKTIARGMPGLLRCTCGDDARVLYLNSHARLRVHWAPGIPCALVSLGETVHAKLGRIAPRECGVVFDENERAALSVVIAREGGRSSIPETAVIEPKGRGVLDTPLARGMTVILQGR